MNVMIVCISEQEKSARGLEFNIVVNTVHRDVFQGNDGIVLPKTIDANTMNRGYSSFLLTVVDLLSVTIVCSHISQSSW